MSAEDDAADTIKPRLVAAGADVARIHRIKAVSDSLADGASGESCFDLRRDLQKLEEALRKQTGVTLIILDPLSAYLGRIDSWRDSEVRALLITLVEFAGRGRVTVLGILHLKKSESDAMLRVGGSACIRRRRPHGAGFGEHPDNPSQRLMIGVKITSLP